MIEIWTATVHEDGRGKCCKVIGVADTEAGAEKIRADYVSHESSLIWPGGDRTVSALIAQLVKVRHARGLTQQNVADRIGTSRAAVCRFETNPRISPLLTTVVRYAHAVGAELRFTVKDQTDSTARKDTP